MGRVAIVANIATSADNGINRFLRIHDSRAGTSNLHIYFISDEIARVNFTRTIKLDIKALKAAYDG